MCLGIPGQVTEVIDHENMIATVDVMGVKREVNIACVIPDSGNHDDLVGQWVLVHVGFAMSTIDPDEAAKTLKLLETLDEAQQEVEMMQASPSAGGARS